MFFAGPQQFIRLLIGDDLTYLQVFFGSVPLNLAVVVLIAWMALGRRLNLIGVGIGVSGRGATESAR